MTKLRLFTLLLVGASIVAALGSGASLAEPPVFEGKSVIVTWIEDRMQRHEGEKNYRPAVREGRESNQANPGRARLLMIARALGIPPVDDLLERSMNSRKFSLGWKYDLPIRI